jgi:quinol monooxygenase YgiN
LITFVAHMQVPPENAAAFEELMAYVVAMTIKNEPGVTYYDFSKSVETPDTYVVVEVYQDQDAIALHGGTAWVRESVPKMLALTVGMPHLEQCVSPGQEAVVSRFEELA